MQIQKLLLHIILSSLLLTGCLTATAANERPDVDPNLSLIHISEPTRPY